MKTKSQLTGVVMLMLLFVLASGSAYGRIGRAERLTLEAAMDKPILTAGTKQTAYLKIGLTGFDLETQCRIPVNIAIVIDKSGSMGGKKIAKAKEAAIMAIDRLNADDIVSVIAYDSNVHVMVPATKVSDKEHIFRSIRNINADGSTALYGGVSKGAEEMRKFLARNRVNRLILLSDGLANIGPQSPAELGQLGNSLIKDGISVTTIGLGLGYNEDLMTQLAYKSDGSHYFAENACDLAKVFDSEFGRALSVVAQEIQIKIKCAPAIRPVRLLGREGRINGQNVTVLINHLYSKHEKYVILEVEVPATDNDQKRKIAEIDVSYGNMKTNTTDKLSSKVKVSFSNSKDIVEKRANRNVTIDVIEQLATERNEMATALRDKGKTKEAREVLEANASFLKSGAMRYNSRKLKEYEAKNEEDAENLGKADWTRQRKRMRQAQSASKQQQ